MRFFWRHADQERFSRVWSPYLMVLLEEGSSPEMGNATLTWPGDLASFWEYTKVLIRYDHLLNFFPWEIAIPCTWLILGLFLMRGRRPPFDLARALLFILGFLATAVRLGCASMQFTSATRYFFFTIFFVTLFAVLTWMTLFECLTPYAFFRKLGYIVPGVFAWWMAGATLARIPTNELTHCLMFALGRESVASNFGAREPAAVYGPAIRATSNLPAGSRVYSLNCYGYCVASNYELESFVSFALGKHWHDAMFEPPERAREVLQQQGLNYFFIDVKSHVIDIIQYSPLFSADNIAAFLDVAWNEGNAYLLTWPGPGTQPLPETFLARYRDHLPQDNLLQDNPRLMADLRLLYERVRMIYETNKGKPYPIYRDPTLPRVPGWQ
jgi:hypothetical protein